MIRNSFLFIYTKIQSIYFLKYFDKFKFKMALYTNQIRF